MSLEHFRSRVSFIKFQMELDDKRTWWLHHGSQAINWQIKHIVNNVSGAISIHQLPKNFMGE